MTHRFCEGHAGFCSTDIHDALQYISLVFLSFFLWQWTIFWSRMRAARENSLAFVALPAKHETKHSVHRQKKSARFHAPLQSRSIMRLPRWACSPIMLLAHRVVWASRQDVRLGVWRCAQRNVDPTLRCVTINLEYALTPSLLSRLMQSLKRLSAPITSMYKSGLLPIPYSVPITKVVNVFVDSPKVLESR